MNLLTAFALASVVAAPVPKTDPAKDAQTAFQGEWKFVEFTRDGQVQTKDVADSKIVVKGDKMEIQFAGRSEGATFTLDPKADPSAIDIKPEKGEKDLLIKGIYKLEKDKLTICFGMDGAERPKEFKSVENSRTGMFVVERAKK